MKKLVTLILVMLAFVLNAQAAKSVKSDITSVIKESGVDTESIAISIKNADNGNIVYSLNDKMLMNPASVQKILTTPAIVDTLGEDYKFETSIYSRGEDSFVIKLDSSTFYR